MEPKDPCDLEAFKQQAIQGLYAGQPSNGDVVVQQMRYSLPPGQ